jgi:hypothetical protein
MEKNALTAKKVDTLAKAWLCAQTEIKVRVLPPCHSKQQSSASYQALKSNPHTAVNPTQVDMKKFAQLTGGTYPPSPPAPN